MSQPDYVQVLDAEALDRLRALDPGGANRLLERVLDAFRNSAEKLLPQLRDARHAQDSGAVRHVAHTLKSSSASIGALRLSQLCAEVERVVRQDGLPGLDAQLDELELEAGRILRVLPAQGEAAS